MATIPENRPVDITRPGYTTPVIAPGYGLDQLTGKIANVILTTKLKLGWFGAFLIAFGMMNVLLGAVGYLFLKGTGIWGINIPVGWGFAIVNFVWWIGIGHAGTLI